MNHVGGNAFKKILLGLLVFLLLALMPLVKAPFGENPFPIVENVNHDFANITVTELNSTGNASFSDWVNVQKRLNATELWTLRDMYTKNGLWLYHGTTNIAKLSSSLLLFREPFGSEDSAHYLKLGTTYGNYVKIYHDGSNGLVIDGTPSQARTMRFNALVTYTEQLWPRVNNTFGLGTPSLWYKDLYAGNLSGPLSCSNLWGADTDFCTDANTLGQGNTTAEISHAVNISSINTTSGEFNNLTVTDSVLSDLNMTNHSIKNTKDFEVMNITITDSAGNAKMEVSWDETNNYGRIKIL